MQQYAIPTLHYSFVQIITHPQHNAPVDNDNFNANHAVVAQQH